jgi:hypothetical protein
MSWSGTVRLIAALLLAAAVGCGGKREPQPMVADAALAADAPEPPDVVEEDAPVAVDVRVDGRSIITTVDSAKDVRGDGVGDTAPPRDAQSDLAPDGAPVKPGDCFAGNKCSGETACQRACFDNRVNTCKCTDGRFFCTGCLVVDAGTDARDFPNCGANAAGKRCDKPGDVCDYRADGGAQLLCVCGTIGADHAWICQ